MNRREMTLKKYLLRKMGRRWFVQSHEDLHSTGIPDLSFSVKGVNGWIELKQIEKWSGSGKKAKPKKFTSSQINWLKRANKHGGYCFVLVKVDMEYYLFDADQAKYIAKGMTRTDYLLFSKGFWKDSINQDEFTSLISSMG